MPLLYSKFHLTQNCVEILAFTVILKYLNQVNKFKHVYTHERLINFEYIPIY